MRGLFGTMVKSADADEAGWLYVEFDDKSEIIIDDNSKINWKLSKSKG